jgi:hypothetical protein
MPPRTNAYSRSSGYLEADRIDYANPPRIEMIVPQNRVAVIEWVSFRATNVQCKLAGVFLQTTLKELNALHTVVGVTDMGPSQVGRAFAYRKRSAPIPVRGRP